MTETAHSAWRKWWVLMLVYLPLALFLLVFYALGAVGGVIVEALKCGAMVGKEWVDRRMDEWDDYKP
jgi:H+/Cl- antiporter ClcA